MARAVRWVFQGLAAIATLYLVLCLSLLLVVMRPPRPMFPPAEDQDVMADFNRASSCSAYPDAACKAENLNFFFGLATAPAHVEDKLNDSWLEFAESSKTQVRAWHNTPLPDERLRFWSSPNVDIELAKEAGSSVFRMGIDWGRLIPREPVNGILAVVDMEAVEHYKRILQAVKESSMRIMLTLFHHSLPKWAVTYGGWTDPRTVKYFEDFARFSMEQFGEYVDYWITFNEPHIFIILSHCSGTWPPGGTPSVAESIFCFSPWGQYGRAMVSITEAHILAYKALHEGKQDVVVGVAHHVGVIHPYGLLDLPIVYATRSLTEFHWIDAIQGYLDFCGINYYGQVLVRFHNRYKAKQPRLRYIITENGIADASDIIRRPYLVEHLLAINAAIRQGVPVDGYLQWTISDNWEWADGYCPKFGIVGVDRSNNLARIPRPSYYLYQQVSKSGIITRQQREREWETLQDEVKRGGVRPFCRAAAQDKRMWADSLDTSRTRAIATKDWRFTKYTQPSLLEYAKRSVEVAGILCKELLILILGGPFMYVSFPPEIVLGEL